MFKETGDRNRQRFPEATVKKKKKVSSLSDHSLYKALCLKNLNEPETHFWALGLRAASVIWLHQVYFV